MPQKPTIFVTRRLPDDVTRRLTKDYEARLNEHDGVLSADQLVKGAEGADALLVTPTDKLNAEVIGRLPKSVKMIATFSVGYEHIDLNAAKQRGLPVSNTPDVLTDATADIALLLMLGAARRAYEGERAVRDASWKSWSTTYMLGVHMTGKRLGIFGMGRIGQAVAKRARAFDMQVHYYNRKRLPADQEQGAIYHESAEEMLPRLRLPVDQRAGRRGDLSLAERRAHRAPAGQGDRGEHVARRPGRRRGADRGAEVGQAVLGRARRVRERAQHPSRLSRPAERVPAAAPRQRDGRHAQRDGVQGAG